MIAACIYLAFIFLFIVLAPMFVVWLMKKYRRKRT